MERVALSLQKWAVERRSEPEDFDLYGRSAFNRYYYSVFLIVRAFILEFVPDWEAGHATIPGMLKGSVERELKNYRKSAMRRQEADVIQHINLAIAALNSLADLMTKANATRVAADYNPAIRVLGHGIERFSLASINISEAHDWPSKARLWTSQIARAWRIARGSV